VERAEPEHGQSLAVAWGSSLKPVQALSRHVRESFATLWAESLRVVEGGGSRRLALFELTVHSFNAKRRD
jgi:hypothetical protein